MVVIFLPRENVDSAGVADDLPFWMLSSHALILAGLNILDSDSFYLRWSGDDNPGSGSRDQFALDNIRVTGLSNTDSTCVLEPGTWLQVVVGLVMLGLKQSMWIA